MIKVEERQKYLSSRKFISVSEVGEKFKLLLAEGDLIYPNFSNLNSSDEISKLHSDLIIQESKNTH